MKQPCKHTPGFADSATPTRRAKPAGVIGAEINRAATVRERVPGRDGPPPVDPGELALLAGDTRASYTHDFAGAQGGSALAQASRLPPACPLR